MCDTQNTRSIIIDNCIGLSHIDMPHAHHDTTITGMTHFQSITIMKSNLQLHKMMADVLWVYPDNCLPETYPRVGGIHLFMGVIGVQL